MSGEHRELTFRFLAEYALKVMDLSKGIEETVAHYHDTVPQKSRPIGGLLSVPEPAQGQVYFRGQRGAPA